MHFVLIMKFVKRFINNVFVFLIDKINSKRFKYNVWFKKYEHLFFFKNVYDNILIFSDFRKFVDYENNSGNHFRNIINNNVVKHYMLEIQIDLYNERLWHRLLCEFDECRYYYHNIFCEIKFSWLHIFNNKKYVNRDYQKSIVLFIFEQYLEFCFARQTNKCNRDIINQYY